MDCLVIGIFIVRQHMNEADVIVVILGLIALIFVAVYIGDSVGYARGYEKGYSDAMLDLKEYFRKGKNEWKAR